MQADRISIHALREEGDPAAAGHHEQGRYFYPRPPRGGRQFPLRGLYNTVLHFYPRPPRGGRLLTFQKFSCCYLFLSTPSARRATAGVFHLRTHPLDFYPRPPRGGRQERYDERGVAYLISIHALREEGDLPAQSCGSAAQRFLSTPSARRATLRFFRHFPALLVFLSTPSARRATNGAEFFCAIFCISIHALREEGDNFTPAITPVTFHFYPRPPRGGRPLLVCTADLSGHISIHALREEGDPKRAPTSRSLDVFLSTPSARRATFGAVF